MIGDPAWFDQPVSRRPVVRAGAADDARSSGGATEPEAAAEGDGPTGSEGAAEPEAASGPAGGAAGADVPGGAPIEVESLLDDLDRVTAERDGYLQDVQRVSAEFANYRKQVDKRQSDLVEQAAATLVDDLLPVLDAFDAAMAHDADGIEPLYGSLTGILEKRGLERVDPAGEPFDPEVHEAVMHEAGESDDGVPVVADVMRTGYRWNGRVLRPAMVKVRG